MFGITMLFLVSDRYIEVTSYARQSMQSIKHYFMQVKVTSVVETPD